MYLVSRGLIPGEKVGATTNRGVQSTSFLETSSFIYKRSPTGLMISVLQTIQLVSAMKWTLVIIILDQLILLSLISRC